MWLFIGPNLLSGIGQVTRHYAELLGHEADFVQFGDPVPKKKYNVGFAFVLPLNLDIVDEMLSGCTKRLYMTVCETETVHESYGILVERYKTLFVPSQFCLDIFRRQFPHGEWKLLPHWSPHVARKITPHSEYVFYTIGNIVDPRKNIKMLLEAFIRLQLPGAKLLLKATCKVPVHWKIPNVIILNGLLTNEEMENIHAQSDCYINCSHSEGVGMGAVEAAIRGKPVIYTDYGGLGEYIPDSPFRISCTRTTLENDDFLYQKGMEWGQPSLEDLMKHMTACYTQRITQWDYPHTHAINQSVYRLLSDQQNIL